MLPYRASIATDHKPVIVVKPQMHLVTLPAHTSLVPGAEVSTVVLHETSSMSVEKIRGGVGGHGNA
jgi:hypothetical protein